MSTRKEPAIRPFTRELRKAGFIFEFRDRSGGAEVTEFSKRQGDRKLRVQLWKDGAHRVSHSTITKLDGGLEGENGTTIPTDFRTVPEMLLAIELEWVRPSTPVPSR
jgi:hypothetical protein